MGYLCPVCEEPFGDDQQCANHLAVTAILHGRSHETWLAEVVDDWETIPRSELAEVVAETADPTSDDHDHPSDHTHPVGQDTDGQPSHGQSAPPHGLPGQQGGQPAITESSTAATELDTEAQTILMEARELTRKMQQRGPQRDDEGKES
jgi:hypothetical protein